MVTSICWRQYRLFTTSDLSFSLLIFRSLERRDFEQTPLNTFVVWVREEEEEEEVIVGVGKSKSVDVE